MYRSSLRTSGYHDIRDQLNASMIAVESSLDGNFNRCYNTMESMIHLPLQGIHKGIQYVNSYTKW
eukprot:7451558-Ditylum_brightwellii.AAC.1